MLNMTLPSEGQKLTDQEIQSMNSAVQETGIQAIHPDKMEAFAYHLVNQLNERHTNTTKKTCDCTCASGKSNCNDQ